MSEKADQKVKPQKRRANIYRMNGKYKNEPKRRAYVPKATHLLNVVDRFGGQPQIYQNGKWANLSKSELRKLVKAEEKARAEAKAKKEEKAKISKPEEETNAEQEAIEVIEGASS